MDFSRFDRRHYQTLSVEAGYAEWASLYDATALDQLDLPLLGRVRVEWKDLGRALDLACGTGRIGVWLKERGVQSIDGVDLTPEMLTQAQMKDVYGQLYQRDARATGLPDGKYGLVTMVLADEHVPDLRPLYNEAARLLAPGGHMINVGYHPHFLLNGIPTGFDRAFGESVAVEAYVHLLSDHFRAATSAGLRLMEMDELVVDEAWETWIAAKPSRQRHAGHPISFSMTFRR